MRPPDLLRAALAFTGILDFRYSLPTLVRNAFGKISPDERSFIPEMELPKVVTAARWHVAIYIATMLGVGISTTHTITGAIVGVGATRRVSAVRWGVARQIVWAWVLTIPAAGAIGAATYWLLEMVT